MLNKEIKDLIIETISLYSQDKLTQSIINQGRDNLKQAVLLLKSQEPSEPIEETTTPVTLEELEAKFPVEPEDPNLQLREDYKLEVNLKADLLTLYVGEGTIGKTKGYCYFY